MTRVLVVSPRFHGYWRSVEEALARRGHVVRTHVYDGQGTPGDRLRAKVSEIRERSRLTGSSPHDARMTHAAVAALRETDPDLLLVVKGDRLGDQFWEECERRHQRRALWIYDELRRMAHSADTLAAAGPIATYSSHDAATLSERGLRVIHVPLAHDPHIGMAARPSHEVVFVGARYPSREALLTAMWEAGTPVRAYGRDWSGHPVDRARTYRVRGPLIPSGRDLTRPEAYGVMAGAHASINLHSDQDGFTMRTFESSGVGALQLVDREDVWHHYEPGREVLVFSSAEEAVELVQRAVWEPRWAGSIRDAGRARTLAAHTFDHRVAALETLWQ